MKLPLKLTCMYMQHAPFSSELRCLFEGGCISAVEQRPLTTLDQYGTGCGDHALSQAHASPCKEDRFEVLASKPPECLFE